MRLIARLDIKNEFVIKGIHLEGLRKIGDPNETARQYYEDGIDEIIFMDAVASLYDRNNLFHIIEAASEEVFVPITIGGGIRNISDIETALASGADKVAINTGAVRQPDFISEAVKIYGSQCIVGSIEAKESRAGWEVYVDNGRERTGLLVLEWARRLEELGIGELLVTSVDHEGTKRGFDIELSRLINDSVSIPVIVSGGMGKMDHLRQLFESVNPSGCAVASVLHYGICGIDELKKSIRDW